MKSVKFKGRIKFLLFVLAIALSWYLGKLFHIDIQSIQSSLSGLNRLYSGAVFVFLYVVVTFFVWFSKDFLWVAAAVLFGAFYSALLISIAETINAVILFSLARGLGRNFVEGFLKDKHKGLDEKLGRLNFIWLFLLRAAPLVPYRFMDLAAGLTGMSFSRYMAAVILGSPLKIFWIQFILAAVGKAALENPAVLVDYFLANRIMFTVSLIYPILVIMVVLKIQRKG